MKMFNSEGQTMVHVRKAKVEDGQIVVTAKLMDAYSMKIYMPPSEMRSMLDLADYDLIKELPDILLSGCKNETALREILGKFNGEDGILDVIFGEKSAEKLRVAGKALGIDSAESVVQVLLPLLKILLAEKE